MLTWKQSFRDKSMYHAELVQSDPINIRAAIVEAWIKFLDRLKTLAPDRWSIVLAYLEAEAGAFTLYPTTREQPGEGIEELSVMLTMYDWAANYKRSLICSKNRPTAPNRTAIPTNNLSA